MKKLDISQVDALFSNGSYPIEFLFYYRDVFKTDKMRRVLRGLSSSFWPLYGEYGDGTIFFDGYREEDYFVEEAVDQEIDIPGIDKNGFETYSRFRLPELKKLFFMKVIHFKNGLVLVPKMNHLAGDGYSYFYFLTVLAALSRPTLVPLKSSLMKSLFKPHHRRTILKEFSFRGVRLEPPYPGGTSAVESETMPRKDIQSVIREAASSGGLRISTNDVLSALAIKKLVGRHSEAWGGKVGLTVPIDVRRRVGEYGQRFFGNSIMLHTLQLDKAHLERSPVRDIAVEIRRSMPTVSKETYIDCLTGLEKILAEGRLDKFKPFDPSSGCLVTNLSRLPADKLDFGTGRPDFILPLTVGRNSAGILADANNYVLRFSL
ncbi:MAG: acyltransferase [Candidatus Aminicenantales bacterium]